MKHVYNQRANCEDLEKRCKAANDSEGGEGCTEWNNKKEIDFKIETSEYFKELKDEYETLKKKFEAIQNEDFEGKFGFPYAHVGMLQTENDSLKLALEAEKSKNSLSSQQLKVKTILYYTITYIFNIIYLSFSF